MAKVGIVMGSASDAQILAITKSVLEEFGVEVDMRVLSAHRTPDEAVRWAKEAKGAGIQVIVAAAGMAAHLAGVIAANTTLPVIGLPLEGGVMGGLDSLLSTVQMPGGTPVATVAVGKAGAKNAGLLALRILALSDANLDRKVQEHKEQLRKEALASGETLAGKK